MEKVCQANILKACKSDGSAWLSTVCDYGCADASCRAKPSPQPSPSPSTPPSTFTSPACNNQCTSGQTCVSIGYGYYGCQNTDTLAQKNGDQQCSGSNLETWQNNQWQAKYCPAGYRTTGVNTAKCLPESSQPSYISYCDLTISGLCSNQGLICVPDDKGGYCGTATLPDTKLPDGANCSDSGQCRSGNCVSTYNQIKHQPEKICAYSNFASALVTQTAKNVYDTAANYTSEMLLEDLNALGPVALATIITQNPNAAVYLQNLLSKPWVQTAGNILALGGTAYQGLISGYMVDPSLPYQLGQSAYQLGSQIQSGASGLYNNYQSILNLPDANNPAGWTLGTYGNQTITFPNTNQILNSLNNYGTLNLAPEPGQELITLYKGIPDSSITDICPTCFTGSTPLNPKDVITQRLAEGQPLSSFFDEYYYSSNSPFSSWTNNPQTAIQYAGDGKIVSINIPTELILNVNAFYPEHPFATDYEFLVPGIIPISSQTQLFP